MVSRVQISLPLLKKNLADAGFFFLRVARKGLGVWKEMQVVNSVGAWNLSVVDFGSAWAAKSASGLVPV